METNRYYIVTVDYRPIDICVDICYIIAEKETFYEVRLLDESKYAPFRRTPNKVDKIPKSQIVEYVELPELFMIVYGD